MSTSEVIRTARKNLGGEMETSARAALADAIALYDEGDETSARSRALKSLSYSIGILHPDYRKAAG